MSFSFSVATASPPPLASIVERIDVKDLRFEEEEEVAAAAAVWPPTCVHLFRPGVSTRGVEACHPGGGVKVRLLACSSPEEHELAVRFVRAAAELAGSRVRPQDAGELDVDELGVRYGPEWAAGQVRSAALVMARFARERGLVTVRGPVRDFHLGKRLLTKLEAGLEADPEEAFAERLLEAMRRTQYVDPERYYEASPIRVDSGGGLRVAVWTPSRIGHLFTPVDYVFLMVREKDGGDTLVVPFDAVPEIAGDRCAFLDERQVLVEPVSQQDWTELGRRAERYRTELP